MSQYPTIGIRPIIDGRRRGVRESLEDQTRAMALAAKKLIEENVFYPDGTPARCVVADRAIGGGAEAAMCAEQFSTENVCATLSVTPCWCYGSETMDLDPLTTKAVWGFNGTERPGAVYLAAVMASHAQRGLPSFAIYGHDVQDSSDTAIPGDVREKNTALRALRAGGRADARQSLCRFGRGLYGYRRLVPRSDFHAEISRRARRVGRHVGDNPPH